MTPDEIAWCYDVTARVLRSRLDLEKATLPVLAEDVATLLNSPTKDFRSSYGKRHGLSIRPRLVRIDLGAHAERMAVRVTNHRAFIEHLLDRRPELAEMITAIVAEARIMEEEWTADLWF